MNELLQHRDSVDNALYALSHIVDRLADDLCIDEDLANSLRSRLGSFEDEYAGLINDMNDVYSPPSRPGAVVRIRKNPVFPHLLRVDVWQASDDEHASEIYAPHPDDLDALLHSLKSGKWWGSHNLQVVDERGAK